VKANECEQCGATIDDKPDSTGRWCHRYDKRGVPRVSEHRWVKIETPDQWEWQECRGCGQIQRESK